MRPGALPNGPGAAAILAAGKGSLVLGIFAFTADAVPAIQRVFIFWTPAGALSGVSLSAIAVWLVTWFVLARRWRSRDVNLVRVNLTAFMMLLGGLLLTFPPFVDFVEGK
jgi:hypothetical protein